MLILSRKPNEHIIIGEKIKISVLEIKGEQVRIGIEAPSDVKIYREEVYREIQAENKRAAMQGDGFSQLPDILQTKKK